MKIAHRSWGPLADPSVGNGLYGAWVDNTPVLGRSGASAELASGLAAANPAERAPLWRVPEFAACLPAGLRELPGGPGVVVTGQQPGFLGGPLLTLYKVATAVALARQRTLGGLPTVPVFWSGDDDDDLAEAFAPVGWLATAGRLVRAEDPLAGRPRAGRPPVLAELEASRWAGLLAGAVPHLAAGGPLSQAVSAWLDEALATNMKWGPGQAGLVERIFAGTGLVVVRGSDSRLHAAGDAFYRQAFARLPELARLVRARGEELAAAGYHAQLGERSLARPLYRMEGPRRVALDTLPAHGTGEVRPGVLLRSPLQDWLLQPAAVVVGPGEFAYLRQLDPLYRALALDRCALVPRLSAWIVPSGEAGTRLQDRVEATAPVAAATLKRQAGGLADEVGARLQPDLTERLVAAAGLDASRAARLASRRVRRFRKGLVAMFAAELRAAQQRRTATLPAWLLPDGQRQERALGTLSGLDLWGDELVAACLETAGRHLDLGRTGRWQQWALEVLPESLEPERTEPT